MYHSQREDTFIFNFYTDQVPLLEPKLQLSYKPDGFLREAKAKPRQCESQIDRIVLIDDWAENQRFQDGTPD